MKLAKIVVLKFPNPVINHELELQRLMEYFEVDLVGNELAEDNGCHQ